MKKRENRKALNATYVKRTFLTRLCLNRILKKRHNTPANPERPLKIPPLGAISPPVNKSDTNPPKKIVCQLCQGTIPNQTTLEKHMRTIHGLNIPQLTINLRENNSHKMSLNENFNDYNPAPSPHHRQKTKHQKQPHHAQSDQP